MAARSSFSKASTWISQISWLRSSPLTDPMVFCLQTEAMFLRYRIVNSRDLSDAAHRMENWLNEPDTGKVTGKVEEARVN